MFCDIVPINNLHAYNYGILRCSNLLNNSVVIFNHSLLPLQHKDINWDRRKCAHIASLWNNIAPCFQYWNPWIVIVVISFCSLVLVLLYLYDEIKIDMLSQPVGRSASIPSMWPWASRELPQVGWYKNLACIASVHTKNTGLWSNIFPC